ncbi:MAG: photosynthetic reaction center cytochrome PufC [Pseudomonadota bacterium]
MKTFRFGIGEAAIAVPVVLLLLAMLFLPDYDRPPIASVQSGFRGTGMALVYNPRRVAEQLEAQGSADVEGLPPLVEDGPRAADAYQNVQVLGDLSAAQFLRLMTAITAWVSPEQGCNYCHAGNNLASDDLYTKRVSRWMIHMTRDLNTTWANHTLQAWQGEDYNGAGVNCYTCHRGNNVPLNVWSNDPDLMASMTGPLAHRAGQNRPADATLLASLPAGFQAYHLTEERPNTLDIRVNNDIALASGNRASIKQAEMTYALMMHMSGALGVNCTYCHNTRAWGAWSSMSPKGSTAYHGIQMVQALNSAYIEPSGVALPPHRLGPLGDVPKVNCTTCHQGVYKPLFGANMVADFPSLTDPNEVDADRLIPGLVDAATSISIGEAIKAGGLAPG